MLLQMPMLPRVPPHAGTSATRLTVLVCAWNEQATLGPCLHSLLAQTRLPDEIIVVDNASTDATSSVARAVPGVRVVYEPRKGLSFAREAGRLASSGDVLAWLDADCRAPLQWLERIEAEFADPGVVAVSGPFRYYDWAWHGRAVLRLYDIRGGSAGPSRRP